ncbi:hypothetical protein KRX19_07925 [Cardiobacteriaceae bacterium TAE3-ERU3]|nr:hypothetical protein [Cardiobacteriaceae bacterium TAE3-ERU3]
MCDGFDCLDDCCAGKNAVCRPCEYKIYSLALFDALDIFGNQNKSELLRKLEIKTSSQMLLLALFGTI